MKTILISRTYATISPESAIHGDYEDQGFIAEREEVTLEELVNLMRGGIPSSCPPSGDTNEWVTYNKDENYMTCEETFESVHYYHNQTNPDAPMLWKRAFKLAGIIR